MDLKDKTKIPKNNTYVWWGLLFIISVYNVIFIINYYLHKCCISQFHKKITIYTIIYVIICAIRAILPRLDPEKLCYYNNFLSRPLTGRILATIAEICYILLITSILKKIVNNTTKSQTQIMILNMTIYAIIIAQLFCWTGCITTNQYWNAIEESTWALVASTLVILLYKIYKFTIDKSNAKNKFINNSFPYFIFGAVIYILFMITIDIPMYIKRAKHRLKDKTKYFNFIDGIKDMNQCKITSRSYDDWKTDMMWISSYFIFAVWSSIYLVIWHTKYSKIK